MGRQNEFYKKTHPEQFSDSVLVKKGNLSRDMFDYYLESLTSKNLEKTFEEFCRKLAESEVCPNLLPQTGPTGGGDSKVDSETYPVSKEISDRWYFGNTAASERWAFAISAKKDWQSKVKSDVVKIVSVNQQEGRGYTKIFFMSNQYVPDKKRAQVEDELRNLHGLDIRILDRNWILDKVFSSPQNIDMTISVFGFSESFRDEVKMGSQDLKRKQEFEENEQILASQQTKQSELVSLAQRNVILARELEYPLHQLLGLIDRSIRLSAEKGSTIDHANAVRDAAWTVYWWYEDKNHYYRFYKDYEKLVVESQNVHLFIDLITLWINLFSLSLNDNTFSIDEHTQILKDEYSRYTGDPSKPNTAIEAKAAFQLIRFFLGDDPDTIVDDIILILKASSGHLDLDIRPLCRAIQEFPVFENTKRFPEMFERSVDIMSEQKRNIEAAKLLMNRGRKLKDEKPYKALIYFSRTLSKLYSEESKELLSFVVLDMADIFQSIGLYWAARNFYYYDFVLCLNQYFKYGDVSPVLFMSAYSLKNIELRLGHVLNAIVFHRFSLIAEHIYPGEIRSKDDKGDSFDYVLALQLLRTPYETAKRLGEFPAFLDEQGLSFSRAAMKYELGHYDEEMLAELGGSTEAFDDVIGKWKDQPALKQMVNVPWYGSEDSCSLHSRVLGCSIRVNSSAPYNHGEFELAATILATIESFLGSGLPNKLISLHGAIEINLRYDNSTQELVRILHPAETPSSIEVVFRDYDSQNIVHEQELFSDFMSGLLAEVISIMFPIPSELAKIEKMVQNDAAFDRSGVFANSLFFGMEVLGKEAFYYPALVHDYPCLEMTRTQKSPITSASRLVTAKPVELPQNVVFDVPLNTDFAKISNTNMYTSSIINIPAWNQAQWKGVMFMAYKGHCVPPVLSFVFGTDYGKAIWEDWRKLMGNHDINNRLGIRIIKGIDRKHPNWYRVAIGPNSFSSDSGEDLFIASLPMRLHTMQPSSDANLKMFESEFGKYQEFFLCPAYMPDRTAEPSVYTELAIKMNRESIIICNASDILENDFLSVCAIIPGDDPIIPKDKENSPIMGILRRKKSDRN